MSSLPIGSTSCLDSLKKKANLLLAAGNTFPIDKSDWQIGSLDSKSLDGLPAIQRLPLDFLLPLELSPWWKLPAEGHRALSEEHLHERWLYTQISLSKANDSELVLQLM